MKIFLSAGNLLDFDKTIAKSLFENVAYPWEVFDKLSDFIMEIGNTLPADEYNKIGDNVWIHKTAVIAPTAYINGPLIIGEGTEVRHCAFIRGTAIVGKNCVVGNSTELKGSILFDNVQCPHYNYIGDSVLGYKSHTGAGVITSNLKSDKSEVTVAFEREKVDTGRTKFGAIIGDYTEVGCNSVLNPGTVVGRHTNIYPLSMVRGYVPENSIYKKQGEVCRKDIVHV
ncbi:MAG: UDP-N-acetylglucosamine pyrophosphorylase [Clostridia bacterium]|nr:UDP-N-acetylglucosamine pyrophosphorylase [Clostridia bacterium]